MRWCLQIEDQYAGTIRAADALDTLYALEAAPRARDAPRAPRARDAGRELHGAGERSWRWSAAAIFSRDVIPPPCGGRPGRSSWCICSSQLTRWSAWVIPLGGSWRTTSCADAVPRGEQGRRGSKGNGSPFQVCFRGWGSQTVTAQYRLGNFPRQASGAETFPRSIPRADGHHVPSRSPPASLVNALRRVLRPLAKLRTTQGMIFPLLAEPAEAATDVDEAGTPLRALWRSRRTTAVQPAHWRHRRT